MEYYSASILIDAREHTPAMEHHARSVISFPDETFKPYKADLDDGGDYYVSKNGKYVILLSYHSDDEDGLSLRLEASYLNDHSVIKSMSKIASKLVEAGFDIQVAGRGQVHWIKPRESDAFQKVERHLIDCFVDFDQKDTDAVYPCLPHETSSVLQKIERKKAGVLGSLSKKPNAMNIVFDMDNTLIDEFGATVRPGIVDLLKRLKADGHDLYLWTNSTKQRAIGILREHKLMQFFTHCTYREDYDPENTGIAKDVLRVAASWLIDDDPQEISACRKSGVDGFLITPFRKGGKPNPKELNKIYSEIKRSNSFFRRLFR